MKALRTCIGCREVQSKSDLIRIARRADGSIVVDTNSYGPGRGAYVCSIKCFDDAQKKNRLSSALRIRVDEGSYAQIRNEVCACCDLREMKARS